MDDRYDPAAASHRALRRMRQELKRHPLVETVQGFPAGEYTTVRATLHPDRLGAPVTDPTVTIRWFAGETQSARPHFSIHYTDETGTEYGWHHEPNPHVNGWGHVQLRTTPDDPYTYQPHRFTTTQPARVVWAVMDHLSDRLDKSD